MTGRSCGLPDVPSRAGAAGSPGPPDTSGLPDTSGPSGPSGPVGPGAASAGVREAVGRRSPAAPRTCWR